MKSCLTLRPHGLQPTRLLCHGMLQARVLEWVAISFSRGSSPPGIRPRSRALQAEALPSEPPGKPISLFMVKKSPCSRRGVFSKRSFTADKVSRHPAPVVYRERKRGGWLRGAQRGVTWLPGKPCRWSPPPWTRTVTFTPVSPGSRARGPQRGACRDV